MTSPLDVSLNGLKDEEIEAKIQELTKKIYTAYLLSKPELLTQLTYFATIYKQELMIRNYEKLNKDLGDDLGQLINVE